MYYGTNRAVCQFDACAWVKLVGSFDLFNYFFMLFPSEIEAPPDWISADISTRTVEQDEVVQLIGEIRDLGLDPTVLPEAIVVRSSANIAAMTDFEGGVVPDLVTRGFRVKWELGGGLWFRALDPLDQSLIDLTDQLGAFVNHACDEL